MKMLMSDYQVSLVNNKMSEFFVKFYGPAETPFSKGVWKIHVELPEQFPYKSPSIGFMNKIFHPNIDELSGSVCLDVINQTWSPMFELINIFEIFLPQLLRYPNPSDPLNGEAAALLMRDPTAYAKKVESYVDRFATPEEADQAGEEDEDEMDDAGPSRPKKLQLGQRQGSSSAADGRSGGASALGTSAGKGSAGLTNGVSNGNGSSSNGTAKSGLNGHAKNGQGIGNGDGMDEDDDGDEDGDEEDEDDKMSDMGELSDGDEFMGEMDD